MGAAIFPAKWLVIHINSDANAKEGSRFLLNHNREVIPEMRSYKMRGEIPSRAMLNVGNIPVDLQVKIEQAIEPYTILPLLDGEVSAWPLGGNGTP
jgi:hypothetical protein